MLLRPMSSSIGSGSASLDRDTRPFDSKRLRFEWFTRLRWLARGSSKIWAMSGLMDDMTFPFQWLLVMQAQLRVEVEPAVW